MLLVKRNSSILAAVIAAAGLLGIGCTWSPVSLNPANNATAPGGIGYLKMESMGDEFEVARGRLEEEHPIVPAQVLTTLTQELPRIYFNYDSDLLSSRAQLKLAQMAGLLRRNPQAQILIEGHCDERGSTEYNFALGQRRAERVRSHLVALGIEEQRLHTISYGEEWPLDLRSLPEAYRVNRRVQFLAYTP
jgi:peptidoglycan-associated lipoprotein